jgi:alpha 1,6-mannosyltransferase
MKYRRSRHNRTLYSMCRIIILFLLFSFVLFIWHLIHKDNEINSLKTVDWPTIPVYIPIIPHNIIQTSKSSSDIDITKNSFIRLNPTYKYIHYNDSSADEFVRETMPDYIYETYISLPKAVMKADYFRYIVLLVKGGIYTDMDTICLRPIDTWIKTSSINSTGLIIGIEADASLWDVWQGDYARQIQFVQWTIAAAPGHPILHQIVKRIDRISRDFANKIVDEKQVLEWTGPALWTDVIENYFWVKYGFRLTYLTELKKPKLVGNDIYVLPITAFSPGLKRMGSESIYDPQAKVQHLFYGTWKDSNRKVSIPRKRLPH